MVNARKTELRDVKKKSQEQFYFNRGGRFEVCRLGVCTSKIYSTLECLNLYYIRI